MHEDPSEINLNERSQQEKQKEFVALAVELQESQETFPFAGFDPDSYRSIKELEVGLGYHTTPIDELLKRFEREGMKVVLGKHPGAGKVFMLPSQSNNVEMDAVYLWQLNVDEPMDERLKRLITISKGNNKFS